MKIVKSPKVFVCCGKYYATTKATQNGTIRCVSCGKVLTAPVKTPYVYVAE